MLGISNGLVRGAPLLTVQHEESFDFSVGTDGWNAYSVDQGSMELLGNQNPSGDGGPDEDGWLRCTWDATQTSESGCQTSVLDSDSYLAGDSFQFSYRIFMPNSSAQFIGSDDITVSARVLSGSLQIQYQIAYAGNTVVTVGPRFADPTTNTTTGESCLFRIVWATPSDFPQADARVYLKDVKILHTGPPRS